MTTTELFFNAIREKNFDILTSFIDNDPDIVNSRDSRGFTPLIFATYFDNIKVAELLLSKQAEVNATDYSGNTALIGVCFKGNIEIALLLIKNGANIEAKNNTKSTPLMFASTYNNQSIIELLLQYGAKKDCKDLHGKTAHDHALQKEFDHLLKLLS
ncbi:ankyrin repeat domain-containing protein [bacterium]|nr:ankyrin repeat domain-containing protein [bacterium]